MSAVTDLYEAHAVSDIALRHAERLDTLEAENERLRAELAKARDAALEEAAEHFDSGPDTIIYRSEVAAAIRALKGAK